MKNQLTRRTLVQALAVAPFLTAMSPRKAFKNTHYEHTKTLRMYDGFATALLLRATWHSPTFIRALAVERARLLSWTQEQITQFEQDFRAEHKDHHFFALALDSSYKQPSTFGVSDGTWQLSLKVNNKECEFESAYKVQTPTPMAEAIYLQLNKWTTFHLVHFKATEPAKELVLTVASGRGNGSLSWKA